jgi:hypothetical protein
MGAYMPLFNEVEGLLGRAPGTSGDGPRAIATRDHEEIRRWGARHRAEPATGEATRSGAGTVDVRDGGAGIRLNFPGIGRFRPITWDEWFEHFDRHHLMFVYEEEIADRAYAVWQARGGGHGHDRRDWFEAERQLVVAGARPMSRYRLTCAPTSGSLV